MKQATCLTCALLSASMLASCETPAWGPSTSAATPLPPTSEYTAAPSAPSEMPQTEWTLVVIGDSTLGDWEGLCLAD